MRTRPTIVNFDRHDFSCDRHAARPRPVGKRSAALIAVLSCVLLTTGRAAASFVDGDFGSGGSVSIIDNNNYTSAQAGSWGTNTGGAWEVIPTDGNPPDAAAFTLGNDNFRILIQATEDNGETIGVHDLLFDINYIDNGTDLSFQYDLYGWDGVGTWVNNNFGTVPGSAELLAADSLAVAAGSSGGWITHLHEAIDFGDGHPFVVVRFEGGNVVGDVLRLDNVQLVEPFFIPEPGSATMLALGALWLGFSRRRRERRQAGASGPRCFEVA